MDNQEINNQGGETKPSLIKNPLVIIAIIVVIALVIFAVVGLSTPVTDTEQPLGEENINTESDLTPEEQAELEELLQAPTDTPDLTEDEMAELEELLQAPAETPDLTPEEQAELEELLSQ